MVIEGRFWSTINLTINSGLEEMIFFRNNDLDLESSLEVLEHRLLQMFFRTVHKSHSQNDQN